MPVVNEIPCPVVNEGRRLTTIQRAIKEYLNTVSVLDREIETQERVSGIKDVKHYAYPTYATAARQRRDNLMATVESLKAVDAEKAA